MPKHIEDIPFVPEGEFTRADLEDWIQGLRAYIDASDQEGRGGDALRLHLSAYFAGGDLTDDEAELIRRGIRLGLHLAAFDRKDYHSWVAKQTLRPRKPTVTDDQIREAVKKFKSRKEQSDWLGISQRQVTRRVAKLE